MPKLVIVESPTKVNPINSYLGDEFKVIASKGHVRDLPKSSLGVDVDNNFKVKYINIQGKSELINQIKKEAKAADAVYLATDPDREG
ncbi:MAG: DNA topoisomerase I, partial [Clostridia bacterium]|nr:DNA topoisomerase I [Clostridia bacterium]